jgi:dihydroxy-acid dehydratase
VTDKNGSYWSDTSVGLRKVELRAAGFDPNSVATRSPIVTVASPYTNAHRCNAVARDCWWVHQRYPMR